MSANELKSRDQFFSTLAGLCQQHSTGILFFITDQNHTGLVFIHEGNIKSLQYRIWTGTKSIKHFKSIQTLKYRFEQGKLREQDTSLLATEAIFQELGISTMGLGNVPNAPTQAETTQYEQVQQVSSIDQNTITRIQSILVKYIGPMAQIVCESEARSALSFDDYIRRIASRIPDSNTAFEFIQQANN